MSECILPPIRRARDYHIYARDGRKFLDLYRANGTCLLGYSVPGMATAVKARCDRHLWTSWPHDDARHLLQALKKAFQTYEPLICPDHFSVLQVLQTLGLESKISLNPSVSDLNGSQQYLPGTTISWQIWLPFLALQADLALAVLPGLGSNTAYVLLRRHQPWPQELQEAFSGCSSLQSTAMLHTIPFLFALGAFPGIARHIPSGFRTHADTLGEWQERSFNAVPGTAWVRQGPYCAWPGSLLEYQAIWNQALAMGIVLNPNFRGVSIFPGVWSRSEAKCLSTILSSGSNKHE